MKQDLQYAVRMLLRAPAFTATVIATLALGIGANSVIFSAVDAVLLRDAPVSDPSTLVAVYTSSGGNLYSQSSYPDYFDLRDSGTFASLMAYTDVSITMDANGQPEPLSGALVSGNYFDVLGVAMAFGRGFAPDEDRMGAPVRVAIVSHAFWQRMLNGDRSVIGQTVRLNSNPYTLVGVAPPGFGGPVLGVATEVWVPAALQPEVDPPAAAVRRARGHSAIFDLRSSRGLRMVGRLPRGASTEQVASRAAVVSHHRPHGCARGDSVHRVTVVWRDRHRPGDVRERVWRAGDCGPDGLPDSRPPRDAHRSDRRPSAGVSVAGPRQRSRGRPA